MFCCCFVIDAFVFSPLQARVVAADKGTPPKSAVALVTIIILRNQNNPVWSTGNIERTVYEDAPLTDTIFTVYATDADRAVSKTVVDIDTCMMLDACDTQGPPKACLLAKRPVENNDTRSTGKDSGNRPSWPYPPADLHHTSVVAQHVFCFDASWFHCCCLFFLFQGPQSTLTFDLATGPTTSALNFFQLQTHTPTVNGNYSVSLTYRRQLWTDLAVTTPYIVSYGPAMTVYGSMDALSKEF
jgi:hypothetical protein